MEPLTEQALTDLSTLMGGFRAEQFSGELFDLFTTPTYWPALLTLRPCLLVGGRGTGKTTVLRGLSFEGQARLSGLDLSDWPLIGLYWRIDTTVVTAFRGGGMHEDDWIPLFSHYVNLTLTRLVLEFAAWWESQGRATSVDAKLLRRACKSLHVKECTNMQDMTDRVEDALVDFEAYINNVRGADRVRLSMLGQPVSLVIQALNADPAIASKRFAFLIDEYENLENYQQRIINTLIKHAGDTTYTFKVGMRETGHRERATLNLNESLVEPADYAYIDIPRRLKESDFGDFAKNICNHRLAHLRKRRGGVQDIESFLPSLSELDEARRLGVENRLSEGVVRLRSEGASQSVVDGFLGMPTLTAYLAVFWNEAERGPLTDTVTDALRDPRRWATRLGNYQHAMLYTIRRGVRGHRKYFAGWDTYLQLADGNIRFLLQLVNEALERHLLDGGSLDEAVSFDAQTVAAQEVGRRIVQQLPGVGAQGAQVTKLVLGLGRVFQVMAAQPQGHTPEVNQFRIGWEKQAADTVRQVDAILSAAVMHLAVIRFAGDKMAAVSGETRDFDYQCHPIFAPFFGHSYRRKRRMTIAAQEVQALVSSGSSKVIKKLLLQSNRDPALDLPEQLLLFRGYYDDVK